MLLRSIWQRGIQDEGGQDREGFLCYVGEYVGRCKLTGQRNRSSLAIAVHMPQDIVVIAPEGPIFSAVAIIERDGVCICFACQTGLSGQRRIYLKPCLIQ